MAAVELRKVKFINNVPIASKSTETLITITRNSVAQAQDIVLKLGGNDGASSPDAPTPAPRKTSVSRRVSERIPAGQSKSTTATEAAMDSPATEQPSPSPIQPRVSTSTATIDAAEEGAAPSSPPPSPPPLSYDSAISEPASSAANVPTASPLLTRTPSIPPKPTRRPPQPVVSPSSNSPVLGSTEQDTLPSIEGSDDTHLHLSSDTIPSGSLNSSTSSLTKPSEHHARPYSMPVGLETPPQSKPPLPPKPARLHRRLTDTKVEDHSLDESDDSDDDDDMEGHTYPPTLSRRASSPSIAIPSPARRSGTVLSQPTSPTITPSIISSSISSVDHRARSNTLPHYSSLNQSALITVIPEGCVDPTNLVEAERISSDNADQADQKDQKDQKMYGPSDHIPLIPVTPLRTTHRSLVEKEKTCTDKIAETRQRLQEKASPPQSGETNMERNQDDDGVDIQTLRENLDSYTAMSAGVKATITKVRELLYRAASVTSVLEFPPYLVAYQLTLVESAIFLEITPAALLTHSPKTPQRSITASTDFFNYLTRMIEYSVLFPPEASGRAQCLHYWVKVAVKLHELENFQTLKAVLSALGTPPIKRLKRTWSFVPRKSMHKFDTLSELMSEARNYGKYREMMASLNGNTVSSAPGSTGHSTSAPGGKLDMLGLNGMTNSLSNLGFRTKEAARRPIVPFLGTFIMDITYLLAAVKKCSSAAPPISAQIPATSSLREKPASILSSSSSVSAESNGSSSTNATHFAPEDDARIQDLLMTLTAYQSGPKYSSQPPRSYIKSATKSHHHFRAPSLSSALHRTAKYRASSMDRQIGANITHQSSYEEDDDDVSGNGLRPTQQLILHYLLTRPWVPEKMVDEMSANREPSKNKNLPSGTGTAGATRASAGPSSSSSSSSMVSTTTTTTTHSWPGVGSSGTVMGIGSLSSQVAAAASIQRGSTGSNSGDGFQNGSGGSRPTSVEE
ncbi:hypothetical protein BGX34_003124 [Mortierella sp. NVP85]|nr:hypothetical protein BGX34_003124 [Mortierella sp. NVP85]